MFALFRSLVDRVKVLLAVRAVRELEADVLAAGADRPAELGRLAAACDAEGLGTVAAELRQRAAELGRGSPLALPAGPVGSQPVLPNTNPVADGTGRRRK